jgi:hypothetical protein
MKICENIEKRGVESGNGAAKMKTESHQKRRQA